jgi:diguanylate cyclase
MNRSIRLHLTLLFGVFGVVLAGAVSYRLGGMLSSQLVNTRGDALRGLAEGTALMLADGLNERAREVTLLAEASSERHFDAAAWQREIGRLQRDRPHYAWLGITDAAGIVRNASGGLLVGADVSQRPWFRGAAHGPFVGDVHGAKLLASLLPAGDPPEPARFIDFAAPLRTAGGRRTGTLGVHADWRWVQTVIDRVRSSDLRDAGTLVYILDLQGHVIHRPAGVPATDGPDTTPDARPALRTWRDGQRYLSVGVALPALTPLTDLGWTVVVRQPAALALAGVAEAQNAVWITGLLAAAGAMGLAWLLAGRVSAPLAAISRAAERIGAGEPGVPIPQARYGSELVGLSAALSRMTHQLVARERALAEVNGQLEARVTERTAQLAQANAHLDRLAHQDALTGLLNRRAADQLLTRELAHHRRHRRPLALLMVDIDHFKRINDSHGHAVGDRVLAAVAHAFGPVLRSSDAAARFGGEEFVVLLPETDAAGAVAVGEKLRAAIAALELAPVARVTVSVGAAVAAEGNPQDLLRRADAALYEAKSGGRNRVVLDNSAVSATTADFSATMSA